MPAKKKPTKASLPKKPHGRPTKYSKELCREICDRLSSGEPLAWICKDKHMPAVRTVSDWKVLDEEFSADFARARDEGFDSIAMDCLEIADDTSRDRKFISKGGMEIEVVDNEVIGRSKIRIETRLKLLGKWDPKRYGDKLDLNATHTGTINVVIGGNV